MDNKGKFLSNIIAPALPLTLRLTHLHPVLLKYSEILGEGYRAGAVSINLSNKPKFSSEEKT